MDVYYLYIHGRCDQTLASMQLWKFWQRLSYTVSGMYEGRVQKIE